MRQSHFLRGKRFSKKALELPPLCAWDIETNGLGGPFIAGAFVTSDGKRELFDTFSDCFFFMVSHPEYRYLAHNASGYEFCYLYPYLYDFFVTTPGVEILPTLQGDTNIIQIRIKKDGKDWIDLRDTLCLFSCSLEKVASAFCPEIPKLKDTIDFEHETFNIHNPDHINYVYRDCDIVLTAYVRLAQQIQEKFHCPLGVTAGSTAMKAFIAQIPKGHCYYRINDDADAFIRKAYYGGLVLPGKHIGKWGAVAGVDVNGAYAYQMAEHSYPIGNPAGARRYVPGKIGFYHVIATVPESVFESVGFNPVPCREKQGLCWPSGTFETFISSIEYDFAVECGCSFVVLWGYVWSRTEKIFQSFVEKCQELELDNNGEYKPTVKIIRNSLYGKFGSKSEHSKLIFSHSIIHDNAVVPWQNAESGEMIEGLYTGKEESQSEYMLPHLAALITAYERVYIMRFIREAYRRGARNVYADTDSIKCDAHVLLDMVRDKTIPTGNKYGEFKVEEICYEFILVGPKCFCGYYVRNSVDATIMKAKGINSRALQKKKDVFPDALENKREKIEFQSVEKLINLIKRKKLVQPVQRKRKITDLRNSFAWQLQENAIYPKGYRLER